MIPIVKNSLFDECFWNEKKLRIRLNWTTNSLKKDLHNKHIIYNFEKKIELEEFYQDSFAHFDLTTQRAILFSIYMYVL